VAFAVKCIKISSPNLIILYDVLSLAAHINGGGYLYIIKISQVLYFISSYR